MSINCMPQNPRTALNVVSIRSAANGVLRPERPAHAKARASTAPSRRTKCNGEACYRKAHDPRGGMHPFHGGYLDFLPSAPFRQRFVLITAFDAVRWLRPMFSPHHGKAAAPRALRFGLLLRGSANEVALNVPIDVFQHGFILNEFEQG